MNRTQIINYLIQKYNLKTYLEIGVFDGINFNDIIIDHKECCDISDKYFKNVTYKMTSDEMFAKMDPNKTYDIIFIDAYHNEEYLDRDIINSLKHLNKGGFVLCHDVLPISKTCSNYDQIYNYYTAWTGTCYKSICKLNSENLEYYTIDNGDYGLTIIKYCNSCNF